MSRPSTREPINQVQRDNFLNSLAHGRTVIEAAADCSRGRRDFYRLKQNDPAFAAEWRAAYDEGTDSLVGEAQRRAVDGVEEPVFHKGEQVATIRRYSDQLLMFLIKQRDVTYRDNSKVEVTGDGGGPVQIEHRGVKLSDIVRVAREAGVELGD